MWRVVGRFLDSAVACSMLLTSLLSSCLQGCSSFRDNDRGEMPHREKVHDLKSAVVGFRALAARKTPEAQHARYASHVALASTVGCILLSGITAEIVSRANTWTVNASLIATFAFLFFVIAVTAKLEQLVIVASAESRDPSTRDDQAAPH